MRVVALEEFLSKSKDFVGDARNIVVASYGKIMGYPDGLTVNNTKDGKRVKVVVGGGMFNGMNFGFFSIPADNPAHVQATKDAGVNAVSGELSEVPESTFVVLYAGTSRLVKMIDLGASLTEKGAKVALLSCGCDSPDRFSRVDQLLCKDNITVVMPQHRGWCDSEYKDLATIAGHFLG
jgi:hypothetical protein